MLTWDLEETRNLVRQQFGNGPQFERARQSLGSVVDRCEYARFHYHAVTQILKSSVVPLSGESRLIALLGGKPNEEQHDFDYALHKIGAHVVACIQSLHAIGDIFAHAVYFSLGINLRTHAISHERGIRVNSVREKLLSQAAHKCLAEGLYLMKTHEHFGYLDALANHSKHRSLVKPALWIDMTGDTPKSFSLKFQQFEYDGNRHEEREVQPFLKDAFNRISQLVVDTGNELNGVLGVIR